MALFMNKGRGHEAFSVGSLKLLGDAASFFILISFSPLAEVLERYRLPAPPCPFFLFVSLFFFPKSRNLAGPWISTSLCLYK